MLIQNTDGKGKPCARHFNTNVYDTKPNKWLTALWLILLKMVSTSIFLNIQHLPPEKRYLPHQLLPHL